LWCKEKNKIATKSINLTIGKMQMSLSNSTKMQVLLAMEELFSILRGILTGW